MPSKVSFSTCLTLAVLATVPVASGQTNPETLSLSQALAMAKARNGAIRAVSADNGASEARVKQSRSAFLPTVTPSYQYNSNRQQLIGDAFSQTEGGSTLITSNWRLLDSGERQLSLRSSSRALDAQRFTGYQTVRLVLFDVVSQYYEALRAQELQRISDSQVERTSAILEQTKARVAVRDVARKDTLQAQADVLNAQVGALQAKNRSSNAGASLKGTLGLDAAQALPALEATPLPAEFPNPGDLDKVIQQAVADRPDLKARRKSLEADRFSKALADREASFGFTLDAGFNYQVTPDRREGRTLTFLLSYPLFDGNLRRERAREQGFLIVSREQALVQAEREVRAEVESAFKEVLQDADRVRASQAAVTAARENYAAASEAQRLGIGTVIDVLTAQVSLVTAESNAIEANYDYEIASVRLMLVTGRAMPGE